MCLSWLFGTSFSYRFIVGTGGFLGGPYAAIGSLFNGLMALCHFHSMFGHWGLFVPWFALSHLLPPSHSLTLTTLTGLRQCFACIKSSPCINNGLGLVCVCHGSSHLPLPSHSLNLTTLTGLRQCIAHIKSSPCINNELGLVGIVPIFT